MAKSTVEVLIEGGKATAAPPLGPALGPMGVNIGQVVADINKKTESFKGMQVPVKVIIDSDTKEYEITIGTPPASALIKKEAQLKKGASNPLTESVGELKIEQLIKIAKMKEDNLLGKDLKQKVKEIAGTCRSMGVLIEGVKAQEAIGQINEGKFDQEIKEEKTEISAEEQKQLEEERKRLQEELQAKRADFLAQANTIASQMSGQEGKAIRAKLAEAGIPDVIINEVAPPEKEAPKA